MCDLISYCSVTNQSPIIQFADNLRHTCRHNVLVQHDEDFSLVLFFSVMLCVCVCMLN